MAKANIKTAIRKAVRDVKAYAKKHGLKANAYGGGGGSGIFSQFESAKYSNKRQWVNTPWPADFKRTMTVFDRQELTRKMRWLSVNSGLVRQMINDMVTYAVGDGIKAQPASGDAAWDAAALKHWNDWAEKPCEITGRYNLTESLQIICKKIDVDGEIFVLKTYGPTGPLIQLIESHRVGTTMDNNVPAPEGMTDGVMFNKYGAVTGYQVIRSDGSGRLVPASAMLHVHIPEQVSGARAYSPIQHSINNLIDVLEVLSLEKVAMKVGADIVRTITRENPQFDGSDADFQAFGMRPQDYPQGVYDNPEQVGNFIGGKTLSLAPGEELKMIESGRPSPNVVSFIEHNNRDSSQGFLPYEFIDLTKANGAAMRVTLGKVDRSASARQSILIHRVLIKLWGYVIGTAVANNELPMPKTGDWHRVGWVTPRRITADAGREAVANQRDIEMGLKTLSDHYAENGSDVKEEVRRRAADARLIIDAAAEFNVPVSMVASLATNVQPEAINAAAAGSPETDPHSGFVPFPSAGNP